MKFQLYPLWAYFQYFLRKEDRHSLQSPFVYQIYQGLKAHYRKNIDQFNEIDTLRANLLQDHSVLTIHDLGAGSHHFSSKERKVSDIVRYSTSSKKHALLYQYFCSLTRTQNVIELGTCLGVNTCYLAEVTQGKVSTFEGADALVHKARLHLEPYKNIQILSGNISETLPSFLKKNQPVDFALLDANHSYGPTISYFRQLLDHVREDAVMVIGDIHWSADMDRAWQEVIHSEKVTLSLDFYECGVLFFKSGLEKAHYVLHY